MLPEEEDLPRDDETRRRDPSSPPDAERLDVDPDGELTMLVDDDSPSGAASSGSGPPRAALGPSRQASGDSTPPDDSPGGTDEVDVTRLVDADVPARRPLTGPLVDLSLSGTRVVRRGQEAFAFGLGAGSLASSLGATIARGAAKSASDVSKNDAGAASTAPGASDSDSPDTALDPANIGTPNLGFLDDVEVPSGSETFESVESEQNEHGELLTVGDGLREDFESGVGEERDVYVILPESRGGSDDFDGLEATEALDDALLSDEDGSEDFDPSEATAHVDEFDAEADATVMADGAYEFEGEDTEVVDDDEDLDGLTESLDEDTLSIDPNAEHDGFESGDENSEDRDAYGHESHFDSSAKDGGRLVRWLPWIGAIAAVLVLSAIAFVFLRPRTTSLAEGESSALVTRTAGADSGSSPTELEVGIEELDSTNLETPSPIEQVRGVVRGQIELALRVGFSGEATHE
jgi:hypothetical protein